MRNSNIQEKGFIFSVDNNVEAQVENIINNQ
jgi:hypothetical protein